MPDQYARDVGYERSDGTLHQVIDGQAMLISPAGDEVVVLNGTGTMVWEALASHGDLDSLVAAVCSAHPTADPTVVATDVEGFLDELVVAGLARVE